MEISRNEPEIPKTEFNDESGASALLAPITVDEARKLHNQMMSYIFTSKHKFVPEEAAIMGEFITRGMALGFMAGVTTALLARRHPALRKHPNLIGFAVAGTVDAISRDYRRPVVYDKLLKMESPLSQKARSMLYSIRTGVEQESPAFIKSVPSMKQPHSSDSRIVNTEPAKESTQPDWWSEPAPVEQPPAPEPNAMPGYYPPVELPAGGPFKGTRTWDEIRKQNNASKE